MDQELQDALRRLKQRDVDTFPVTVLSLNKTLGTCKVTDGELEFDEVQLSSVIDANKSKFYLFPKVGSSVLVSPINENLKRLYIEAYSEIESMNVQIEATQFRIDKDGFLLKKQNETLKKLMADLFDAIAQMKFTVDTTGTAAAQTGKTTIMTNAAQFTSIKTRFNQFLKDN